MIWFFKICQMIRFDLILGFYNTWFVLISQFMWMIWMIYFLARKSPLHYRNSNSSPIGVHFENVDCCSEWHVTPLLKHLGLFSTNYQIITLCKQPQLLLNLHKSTQNALSIAPYQGHTLVCVYIEISVSNCPPPFIKLWTLCLCKSMVEVGRDTVCMHKIFVFMQWE